MWLPRRLLVLCPCALLLCLAGLRQEPLDPGFHYEDAELREAHFLESHEAYQACVATLGDQAVWVWLDHEKGPRMGGQAVSDEQDAARPSEPEDRVSGDARPTLTEHDGVLYKSFEGFSPDTGVHRVSIATQTAGLLALEGGINHRTASSRDGLWAVWQADRGGSFDVLAARLTPQEELAGPYSVGDSPRGDWRPDVTATPDGHVCVVWDRHSGSDYDVVCRWLVDGEWGPVQVVADGPAYQARARIASDSQGRVVCAWEEGGENWGRPYRSVDKLFNNITDARGPLHRFRRIELACLTPEGVAPFAIPMPQPAFEAGAARADKRPGVERLGVYYERPELCFDREDRLWVAYRHFAQLQVGCTGPTLHHVEQGYRIGLRHVTGSGQPVWSKSVAFDARQRDGMQRLSMAPTDKGVHLAWSAGRSDRRLEPEVRGRRGVALAQVDAWNSAYLGPLHIARQLKRRVAPEVRARRAPFESEEVAGTTYRLVLGDLHRHTDLSLCFPFYDGSIEDAYRYAIDVAELDFLGITDHTRDLDKGMAASQLWWRCQQEVRRHELKGHFVPMYAYERSHRDTDHNVITLKPEVIKDFPPPLPEFWAEIDGDTFTIPHNPFIGKVWDYQQDDKRPLLEVYQGFRNESSVRAATIGLEKGYHLGFIASSDHLSTSASYACVWTEAIEREPIFRALQARRSYGASAPIRLVWRLGECWMGEVSTYDGQMAFTYDVQGTAPIARVEVVMDGEPVWSRDFAGESARERSGRWKPAFDLEAPEREHWAFVRVIQADGNQAWSSPIWFTHVD